MHESPEPLRAGNTPELSVVVLCYRAEELANEYVRQMIKELEDAHIDYELVLVANYMPHILDRTPDIVRNLARQNNRIMVIAKEKQGMMGWDLRSGLEVATGRHLATIDGDAQMPSYDVIRVYDLLKSGGYDIVKTFRAERNDGFSRWLISSMFNMTFRLLFWKSRYRDINSKPKVMTRAAYATMHLISNDWFTDAEIMIEALHHGMTVAEIPTVFYENHRRVSFVHITAIWEFLRNLFFYRFFRFPPFAKHR